MHETADDLARLQAILDRSYESAGRHLRDIITPERRLSAADLAARLQGMCLLVLATVTRDGRPMAGAGRRHLLPGRLALRFGARLHGASATSATTRAVSAVHLPSEEFSVTVHGRATLVDVSAAEQAGLRRTLLDIYVPRYGAGWETFLDSGPVYARIDAERMFTFFMPAADAPEPVRLTVAAGSAFEDEAPGVVGVDLAQHVVGQTEAMDLPAPLRRDLLGRIVEGLVHRLQEAVVQAVHLRVVAQVRAEEDAVGVAQEEVAGRVGLAAQLGRCARRCRRGSWDGGRAWSSRGPGPPRRSPRGRR